MDTPEGYTLESDICISLENLSEMDLVDGLRFVGELHEGSFPDDPGSLRPLLEKSLGSKSADDMGRTRMRMLGFIGVHHGTWRYVGKGVRLGDGAAIVCWYKPKESHHYRVIRGDLSTVDMAEAELPTVPDACGADGVPDATP